MRPSPKKAGVRIGAVVALAATLVLAGCAPATAPTRQSSPLAVSLTHAGAPSSTFSTPPAGFEWLSVEVRARNVSKGPLRGVAGDGNVFLSLPASGLRARMINHANGHFHEAVTTASGGTVFPGQDLPAGATMRYQADFLVKKGTKGLSVAFRLPGYSGNDWPLK
jgi:hypothetical protein